MHSKKHWIYTAVICLIVSLITPSAAAVQGGIFDSDSVYFYFDGAADRAVHTGIFNDENPCVRVKLVNPEGRPYDAAAEYSFEYSKGSVIYKSQKTVTVNANTVYTETFAPQFGEEYGEYKAVLKLTGEFGVITKELKAYKAPRSERTADIGVCMNYIDTGEFPNATADDMLSAGIGNVRQGLTWIRGESTKGTLKIPEWIDDKITALLAENQNITLILHGTNTNYDENTFPTSDEAVAAFAKYCGYVAEHYKGRIDTFEIWDEPNLSDFTGGKDITGADYAKLARAAYTAITAANKDAKVLVGGISRSRRPAEFTEEILEAGIKGFCHGFSYHPYTDYYPDECDDGKNFMDYIKDIEDLLDSYGMSDIPIYLTEYGKATYTGENTGQKATAEEQAAANVRAGILTKTDERIKRLYYYSYMNRGGDKTNREDNFGITDEKHVPKKAYYAIAQMNKLLDGADFVSTNTQNDGGYGDRSYSVYRFADRTGIRDVFILWTTARTGASASASVVFDAADEPYYTAVGYDTVVLHLPEGSQLSCYDMLGNRVDESVLTSDAKLSLSQEPMYIVSEKPCYIDAARNGNTVSVTGKVDTKNSSVTLRAETNDSLNGRILAAMQTKTDPYGKFAFNFNTEESDFRVSVFDGDAVRCVYDNCTGTRITSEYYINGMPVKTLDSVRSGDTLTVRVEIDSPDADFDGASLIAALYGENTGLKNVKSCIVKRSGTEGNDLYGEIELIVNDAADANMLKVYLWMNDMIPMSECALIGKRYTMLP